MSNKSTSASRIFWIIVSMVIFLAVELFLGGFVAALIRDRFVGHVFFIKIEMLMMVASYFFGGLLVGLISPGIRIFEPAVGAALAVFFTFAYSFFTPVRFYGFATDRVLFGSLIAFILAIVGADLGERLAAKLGNRASRDYIDPS